MGGRVGAGVALIGFMGAGKSTAGPALAERLGWPAVDLDRVLVERHGPIDVQIREDGLPAFRAREREAALGLCGGGPRILATGGGTLLDPEVRRAIATAYRTVWLDVPLGILRTRLGSGIGRPLWDDTIEARYAERVPIYRSADLRVDGARPPEEVVDTIARWVASWAP